MQDGYKLQAEDKKTNIQDDILEITPGDSVLSRKKEGGWLSNAPLGLESLFGKGGKFNNELQELVKKDEKERKITIAISMMAHTKVFGKSESIDTLDINIINTANNSNTAWGGIEFYDVQKVGNPIPIDFRNLRALPRELQIKVGKASFWEIVLTFKDFKIF